MNATSPPSKYTTADRVFVFTAALILAAIAIGSDSASGQSFDCRSARAADEVTICHEPGLGKLDQDLAALRRQRQKADRDDVEDNEIAFLNARHRCGENRGCIEESYRNRIQELARFFSDSPAAGEARGQRQGSSRTAQKSKDQQGLGTHIRHELRDQINSGLVTIILSGLDSGDISDATDLVTTLKGAHLRILPVAGEGAARDVTDLLFARGIDIAIVQTDVLASLKRQAPFPGIENFLQYISKLYDEEVHILTRREIHSLEDLASKPVNFGPVDSGTFLSSSAIFGVLGLGVEITTLPQPLALDKLRRGEIAALVYTAAKPARLFQDIRPEEGLHFLSISAPEALRERYGQAALSAADYPDLIEQDKPISTLSVGTVLAVYNWPAGTERYRNVAHFVDTFFGRLAELRMSRHHPKWRVIDIHASVGGWTRFEAASQWIKSAERVPNKPTRIAGPPFPMEGSTTSLVQPSAGYGDKEPPIAELAVNHPKSVPIVSPSTASPQEPRAQEGDRVSFNKEQLDALFREFFEYQKREVKREAYDTKHNETLFAEFEIYVKHLSQQPDRPHSGARVESPAVR